VSLIEIALTMPDASEPITETAHPPGRHGVGHIVSIPTLVGAGLLLLILTWLTVVMARIDLGEANIWIALGIAVLKGSVVALIFMHLRWDRPFNGIVFVTSLAFVTLLIALAMTDTSEYQKDVRQGDAPAVKSKLEEAQP
jgi:cytochrome c oxidase subunit 4